ncbi:hypothetical protein NRA52_18820 [Acinetobacter baumannii]|uniref:hypothetical protein n=1 Tax=Acinetobacter baumannii TaxID=470 RepID=UPI0004506102|nr:hypothetical protein [Acinetobacter baumannii]EKU7310537.1 hypothetical protein [Acinetobacter baumannii]EXG92710.1 hypothetical protein J624_0366 [Acinetobacter baumannii 1062314]MBJ9416236.1 hypothetical protein [Acinetobacter baumannii]MDC5435450.1 hypothetical protein [Acinetobacter baumannii]MDN8291345.1 hypothetical protein [Acinetobacter baumannii]
MIEVKMILEFSYTLREEYEGDEGTLVPQLFRLDNLDENRGVENFLEGNDDYLYFIGNVDTSKKVESILIQLSNILDDNSNECQYIMDGYFRKAEVCKDITAFNIMPNIQIGYRGGIPTDLFLKILNLWGEYLKSRSKGKVIVEV